MVTNLRKRRGSQCELVTQWEARVVVELEGIPDQPRTADHVQQILMKRKAYDKEFKGLHFQTLYFIDEKDRIMLPWIMNKPFWTCLTLLYHLSYRSNLSYYSWGHT